MSTRPLKYVLGVDPGGTKCEVLLVAIDGAVVGWGRCDAGEAASRGSGRSQQAIWVAMRQALRQAGFCGGRVAMRGTIRPEFVLPPELRHHSAGISRVHDVAQALDILPGRAGVVALAGTGAAVSGRRPDGREYTLDGAGPLLGDRGSAFAIGIQALRATMAAKWHPRRDTTLRPPVLQALRRLWPLGSSRFRYELFRRCLRDRSEVASLAGLVDAEARKGDRVSIAILREAAEDMAGVVWDLIDGLGMERNRRYILVGMGGVITHSDIFWNHLRKRVRAWRPAWKMVRLAVPPAVCLALAELKDRLPPAAYAGARSRLMATLPTFVPGAVRMFEYDGKFPRALKISVPTRSSIVTEVVR